MSVTSEQLKTWAHELERWPTMRVNGEDITELCSVVAAYLRANIPVPVSERLSVSDHRQTHMNAEYLEEWSKHRCPWCKGDGLLNYTAAIWWKPWTWGTLREGKCVICKGTGIWKPERPPR